MDERSNPSAPASSAPEITKKEGDCQQFLNKSTQCDSHSAKLKIPNGSLLQSAATTSSLYQEFGLLGSKPGEMLMMLPLGLYSFRMSWGPASAAERKRSERMDEHSFFLPEKIFHNVYGDNRTL